MVFSPAGSCAQQPNQRLSHLPLDINRHYQFILNASGHLFWAHAIPRLQTARYAPVFAAGYWLSTPSECDCPRAILFVLKSDLCHRQPLMLAKNEDESFYLSALMGAGFPWQHGRNRSARSPREHWSVPVRANRAPKAITAELFGYLLPVPSNSGTVQKYQRRTFKKYRADNHEILHYGSLRSPSF